MSTCPALGSASVSWRMEVRRQRSLNSMFCGTQHEHLPCLALDNAVFHWHDELQLGGIAPDGCAALKLVCGEVQHEHWPCLEQSFGQLAC
jgi:hypothetical protein